MNLGLYIQKIMYQPLSSLNLPEFKIQELAGLGCTYCKDITSADKSGIKETEWQSLTQVPKTTSALDTYQKECVSGKIPTSIKALDEALEGGVAEGLITEFCGKAGCGKTQLCFCLCVNAHLPRWCGGLAGESVYVSTNKGFACHRLKEIASIFASNYLNFKSKYHSGSPDDDFTLETILQKIHCINIEDYVEFIAFVKFIKEWLKEHALVRLIAIDGISVLLKTTTFKERTRIIYEMLSELQQLAEEYRFAIILTNDVTTRISSTNRAYHTPSLGGSYYHRINTRIHLSKTSNKRFSASIVKNSLHAPRIVEFELFPQITQ